MGRPILFLVNDQQPVLDALAADLGRRFGVDYQILAERSPAAALATLDRLVAASEEVALLVAAQRMAGMTGVEFLVRAHALQPRARRVLLVGRRE
jgi:thioredoxin reductase (NADPH)